MIEIFLNKKNILEKPSYFFIETKIIATRIQNQ
jgi:hypothetical protein